MDEIVLCQLEHRYMDENDEFDVYKPFDMDEVQKHGMMWP
jgi:hypothetical protein